MGLLTPNLNKMEEKKDIKGLIRALTYKDLDVRSKAAEALGKIGDEFAIDPLKIAYKDDDPIVRDRAIWALGEISERLQISPYRMRAEDTILTALSDLSVPVRKTAMRKLSKLMDIRAVEPLISALADKDVYVRNEAYSSLVAFGKTAVNPLLIALKDNSNIVHRNIIKVLCAIGDTRGVEVYTLALRDNDPEVRKYAADLLGLIKDPGAIKPLVETLEDIEYNVRHSAANALVSIGVPAAEAILSLLSHKNNVVRVWGCWALGQIGEDRFIEPLTHALNDEHKHVKFAAINALVRFGNIRAVNMLIDMLLDCDKEMSEAAAADLERINDARTIAAFVSALTNREKKVRKIAANALSRMGWAVSEDEYGAYYWAELENWELCKKIGRPAIVPLISALEDKSEFVQKDIFRILLVLGWQPDRDQASVLYWILHEKWSKCVTIGTHAIEPLFKAYQKAASLRSYNRCLGIIDALGKIGSLEVVDPLIAALNETAPPDSASEDLSIAFVKALSKITEWLGVEDELVAQSKISQILEIFGQMLIDQTRHYNARVYLAKTIGRIGDSRGVDSLIVVVEELTAKPWGYQLIRAVLKSLAQIGDRRACAPILDYLFKSIFLKLEYKGVLMPGDFPDVDYPWQDYKQDFQKLFGDYTDLIPNLIGYSTYTKMDDLAERKGENQPDWDSIPEDQHMLIPFRNPTKYCDISANQRALGLLYKSQTKVANNLLITIKDIPLAHDSLLYFPEVERCFIALKQAAEDELVKRGNPLYEPSAYLDGSEWELSISER